MMKTKTRYLIAAAAMFALSFAALDVPALGFLLGTVGAGSVALLGRAYDEIERKG